MVHQICFGPCLRSCQQKTMQSSGSYRCASMPVDASRRVCTTKSQYRPGVIIHHHPANVCLVTESNHLLFFCCNSIHLHQPRLRSSSGSTLRAGRRPKHEQLAPLHSYPYKLSRILLQKTMSARPSQQNYKSIKHGSILGMFHRCCYLVER